MLQTLKSILKDAMWLFIGTVATLGYVSYKAGKRVVDDVPEMMDFAQDTYGQVKDVLSKDAECTEPFHDHHDGCPECHELSSERGFKDTCASCFVKIRDIAMFRS